MGLTVVCLPNEEFTQSGFESKDEARRYIEALACSMCVDDVKRGYIDITEDGNEVRYPIEDIMDTSCGRNFLIITDEDYDKAETLEDLFIAAGYKPGDEKTEKGLSPEQKQRLSDKDAEREAEQKKDEEQE